MTRPDKPGGQSADPETGLPLDDPEGGPPSGEPGAAHEAEEVPEWH